ncbi:MAG: serine hydroxymethyltransferase [Clostridiales bacterium]|jgi:glycine hydroxymethyltransferase|nr:serine hydroxymethyltransferase [Clostridiales bacterium]
MKNNLQHIDSEIFDIIELEKQRQQDYITLIASENYTSSAVLAAQSSCLTNKYAEGYPDRRYYGGCVEVDKIEKLSQERLKKLFGSDHANVQPHSGTNANIAAYFALCNSGDTILGMNLNEGGHLTHGSKVNISGKWLNSHTYGVDSNGLINYDRVQEIAKEAKPKVIVCGASAYPRQIDFSRFRQIADSVGAYLIADIAHIAGLIVANLHQNPVQYAHIVTSTTHKTLRGPRGGIIMCVKDLAKQIDGAVFPGTQGGPLMHIIAAKAVAFKEALQQDFVRYQTDVKNNAQTLANALKSRGLKLVSDGTDNHLMLIDLTQSKIGNNLTGKEVEDLLFKANIVVNKNTVPNERRSPFITSGLRVGTPAATTRGLQKNDFITIADMIADIIEYGQSSVQKVHAKVLDLCKKYPL